MKNVVSAMRFFIEKGYSRVKLLETDFDIFATYINYQLPQQSFIEIQMRSWGVDCDWKKCLY